MESEKFGPRRLSVCPECDQDFVVPVDGVEYDERSWLLILRCGACGLRYDLHARDDEVDALCAEVDEGLDRLAAGVERLDRERMSAEADIFATALQLDLISGDDFAT